MKGTKCTKTVLFLYFPMVQVLYSNPLLQKPHPDKCKADTIYSFINHIYKQSEVQRV